MQQYSKTYINLYPNYNLHMIVYISYKKEDKFEILFNRSDSTEDILPLYMIKNCMILYPKNIYLILWIKTT